MPNETAVAIASKAIVRAMERLDGSDFKPCDFKVVAPNLYRI
jgi:hypothetical protein